MQTGSAPGYLAMFYFHGSDCGKAPLKAGSHSTNLLFQRLLCNHFPPMPQFLQMNRSAATWPTVRAGMLWLTGCSKAKEPFVSDPPPSPSKWPQKSGSGTKEASLALGITPGASPTCCPFSGLTGGCAQTPATAFPPIFRRSRQLIRKPAGDRRDFCQQAVVLRRLDKYVQC